MKVHKNARLTPRGREVMVSRLERGERPIDVAKSLSVSTNTLYKWRNRFREEGITGLSDRSSRPKACRTSLADEEDMKEQLFRILHSPPSEYGFNRTTWKINDLQQALEKTGVRIGRHAVRKIIKDAGYRWLKAKRVLTSKDPDYRIKLDQIHHILSNLGDSEGFFPSMSTVRSQLNIAKVKN